MKIKLSVIGLGYVGLPLAIEFGKIYNTLGFDINREKILSFKKKKDLNDIVNKKKFLSSKKLIFSYKENDLENTDIFIVTVSTPIYKNKIPDLRNLISATKIISKYIKKNNTIIFESTVFPGVTENLCIPIIEKYSKLKLNKDFLLASSKNERYLYSNYF